MMDARRQRCVLPCAATIALASLLIVTIGCGQPASQTGSADHDHEHEHGHDHASMSYSEAVAEVEELRDKIKSAFEAGNAEDAHDDLHHIGDLLDAIPKLAKSSDMSADDQAAVKEAADRAFNAFGDLDKSFHPEDGQEATTVAYDDMASTIDEGIAVLVSKLAAAGDDDAHAGHDHDDDEHGDHDHGDHDEEHDHHAAHDDGEHDHDEGQ